MRRISYVLGLLAIGLCVFSWWGLMTTAGRQRFDEMAGMIPLLSVGAGIIAGLFAILLFVVSTGRNSDSN